MRRKVKIFEYETLDSTNAEAKRYALSCNCLEPVLFVAREQSAGRGRLGRSFLSRGGRGIYMSLLYFTQKSLADAISVTTAAAVAVASAIEGVTGERMMIKWVNDVYSERGKVSGILTETVAVGDRNAIIVGIGINVGENDFPEELRGVAASIGEINEEERQAIIKKIVDALIDNADSPSCREYMKEYRERFMLSGAHVDLFSAGEKVGGGEVLGVTDDGGLVLLRDGESESVVIRTGEVSIRNIKK